MAQTFALGSLVVNFGVTAKVVGFFRAAGGYDGQGRPIGVAAAEDGWPILKALGRDGRARGGKWVADPAKCTAADAGIVAADRAFHRARRVED